VPEYFQHEAKSRVRSAEMQLFVNQFDYENISNSKQVTRDVKKETNESKDYCEVLACNGNCSNNVEVYYLIYASNFLCMFTNPWPSETDFRVYHAVYGNL
jgi:hypothetical protein